MLDLSTVWPVAAAGGFALAAGTGLFVWRSRVGLRHPTKATSNNARAGAPQVRGKRVDAPIMSADFPVEQLHPVATRLLTRTEQEAWQVLRRALPDHLILAQVPLARFIRVQAPSRASQQDWLQHMGSLCADLVVCDAASKVVAVVDIRQPLSPDKARLQARQSRMDRALTAAHIPIHIWLEGALPGPTVARDAILGTMAPSAQSDAATSNAAKVGAEPVALMQAVSSAPGLPRVGMPISGLDVAEASLVDFNPDTWLAGEPAGLHADRGEPPPSMWFEDADARAAQPE